MPPPHLYRISPALLRAATVVCAVISLCFWFLYFSLYWPYRDLFNEEGRYFDESRSVVYHAQNSWLIFPALAFLLLAVGVGAAWQIRRQAGPGVDG